MQSPIRSVFVLLMVVLSGCGGPSSLEECVLNELRGLGGKPQLFYRTAETLCRQKYPALAAAADERERAAAAAKVAAAEARWKAAEEAAKAAKAAPATPDTATSSWDKPGLTPEEVRAHFRGAEYQDALEEQRRLSK